jgi:membrane dipeptidase
LLETSIINMPRLTFRALSFLIVFASFTSAQNAGAGPTVSSRARALHNSAIVIDTHADTPQRFLDRGFDIGSTDPNDAGQISLDKARAGNLDAEFFSIWVDPQTTDAGHYDRRAMDLIA